MSVAGPPVRRVAVIGCGGSGKTTLANELGRRLALPVVHIDSHYCRTVDGEQIESTPEEWKQCHRRLIVQDFWIIDGMKLGVLGERLARADTVGYLDLPTRDCLSGILRRRLRYGGRLRPDLGVYDRINVDFLWWVWSFRRRHRPKLLEMIGAFDDRRSSSGAGARCPDSSTQLPPIIRPNHEVSDPSDRVSVTHVIAFRWALPQVEHVCL